VNKDYDGGEKGAGEGSEQLAEREEKEQGRGSGSRFEEKRRHREPEPLGAPDHFLPWWRQGGGG